MSELLKVCVFSFAYSFRFFSSLRSSFIPCIFINCHHLAQNLLLSIVLLSLKISDKSISSNAILSFLLFLSFFKFLFHFLSIYRFCSFSITLEKSLPIPDGLILHLPYSLFHMYGRRYLGSYFALTISFAAP